MIRKIQNNYNPHSIIILKNMDNTKALDKLAPWISMHDMIDDKITFYICENFACKMPTTDIDTAMKYLQ